MREIPSLPAKLEPQLRNLLSAVRDAINNVIKGTKTNTDSINKLKQWVDPVFNPDYIATDDAASLLLDKFKGDSGDAVDIIFVRSELQPTTPEGSLDTPVGWFTFVDDANVGGVSLPLWSSVGKQTTGNTYVWETPVRIEGGLVAELSIFVRSATAPGMPTGGTYAFTNPPVLVAPDFWFEGVPSGNDPLYTSRAVVATTAGNISPIAVTGWSTPVISAVNGVNGIVGLLTNEVHTIGTASDGTGGSFTGAGGNFKVYSGLTDVTSLSTFAVTVGTISGLTLTIGAATGIYSLAGTWTADTTSFTLTATYSGTTITKIYTISKSKAGAVGGLGPTVVITYDRSLTFNSTDTTLVTGQSNIVLTANTANMTGTITYAWSGSYFDVNPTAGTSSTYTITAAAFNSVEASRAGKITCSVTNNSITYKDTVTITRLNSSTAAAGATVGADASNLNTGVGTNMIPNSDFTDGISGCAAGWQQFAGAVSNPVLNSAGASWQPDGMNTVGHSAGAGIGYMDTTLPRVVCSPNTRYEIFAYLAGHRCYAQTWFGFYDAAGVYITEGSFQNLRFGTLANTGGTTLASFEKTGGFVTSPWNAAFLQISLRSTPEDAGATSKYVWGTRFFAAPVTAYQTALSPWTKAPSTTTEHVQKNAITDSVASEFAVTDVSVPTGVITNTVLDGSLVSLTASSVQRRLLFTVDMLVQPSINTAVKTVWRISLRASSDNVSFYETNFWVQVVQQDTTGNYVDLIFLDYIDTTNRYFKLEVTQNSGSDKIISYGQILVLELKK